MPLNWQGFAIPKRGNSPDEYEDAFAGNPKAGRFAIADGASESSFAALWAKLLVDGFTQPAPKAESRNHWLEPLREQWSSQVSKLQLPWYAETKRELGASATFIGLVLKRSTKRKEGRWLASAVGDSCIFQIHKEELVNFFPVIRSQDFNNVPSLLNSLPCAVNSFLQEEDKQERSQWCRGDRFLLMTDALAQWFLGSHEGGSRPWQAIADVLSEIEPERAFKSWIDRLRDDGGLRNDDVTLVVIDP